MSYTGALASRHYSADDLYLRLDEGLSINKTVTGVGNGHHNVFYTNYAFFAAAAIIEMVCLALIAPTYWGWWKVSPSNPNDRIGKSLKVSNTAGPTHLVLAPRNRQGM